MRIVLCVIATFLAFHNVAQSESQTVLERYIYEQNPCQFIKTDTIFGRIGVDYVDRVEFRRADILLRGDIVTVSLEGSLACRTSDRALFPGDASIKFALRGRLEITSCEFLRLRVSLKDFGGRFGQRLVNFSSDFEARLQNWAYDAVRERCQIFLSMQP